jgi:sugar lactone lactonase YvrE
MGRTEDVQFSPKGTRLGVAEFKNNRIALFNLNHEQIAKGRIGLTHPTYVSSPWIDHPHGIAFIDDETIVVANRNAGVCIFRLSPASDDDDGAELVLVLPTGDLDLINTPGSVAVAKGKSEGCVQLLVCNNYSHYVTRHDIESKPAYALLRSEILLRKWLNVPDGVCVSGDGHWIAISNHETHAVLVYENSATLNERSDPTAILRSMCFPHGLCFTDDGQFIFLADAGAPYVHVYARRGDRWCGVHDPALSFRVMDDDTFRAKHYTIWDGGPKGLHIDRHHGILVTTCHGQPLAFHDLRSILEKASSADETPQVDVWRDTSAVPRFPERESQIWHELDLHRKLAEAETRALRAERLASRVNAQYRSLQRSRSWRFTAPLRGVASILKKVLARSVRKALRNPWDKRKAGLGPRIMKSFESLQPRCNRGTGAADR